MEQYKILLMDGVSELEFYIDPRDNMKITIDDEEYEILSLTTQGNIVTSQKSKLMMRRQLIVIYQLILI